LIMRENLGRMEKKKEKTLSEGGEGGSRGLRRRRCQNLSKSSTLNFEEEARKARKRTANDIARKSLAGSSTDSKNVRDATPERGQEKSRRVRFGRKGSENVDFRSQKQPNTAKDVAVT